MDTLPEQFPSLPDCPDHDVWSANALEAYSILQSAYRHGRHALHAGDNDSHRFRIHSDRILNRMLPILEALEAEVLNHTWVRGVAQILASLAVSLERAAVIMDGVSELFNILFDRMRTDSLFSETRLNSSNHQYYT
jgi:hypothetical protein